MERLRSGLFVDFDNIFLGLLELDRPAALRFAQEPSVLLEGLATYALETSYRDLLVRRAYLNPNGWTEDAELGNDNNRLYLQRFRPHLTQAGYEVVDCPALTAGQKNAADIRIVIDVLDAVYQRDRFDEVVIASSDADFTPLLQRARAHDVQATVITAGRAAPAYRAVAHHHIDEQALITLLAKDTDDPVSAAGTFNPPTAGTNRLLSDSEDRLRTQESVAELLLHQIEAAEEPLLLANLGHMIHQEVDGRVIRQSSWFGTGSLSNFLASVGGPQIVVRGHYVWDADRHEPPADLPIGLPAGLERLAALGELPQLTADAWPVAFDTLAEYAREHPFRFPEATAWARDRLADHGHSVGRRSIGLIIRGAKDGGVRLDSEPPPQPAEIRDGYIRSLTDQAQSLGLDLDATEMGHLHEWIGTPSS